MKMKNKDFSVGKYILNNISRRRLRTGLTISGIAICVAVFVLISSLSQGLHAYTLDTISQRREGFIYMMREQENFPFFTEAEVGALESTAVTYLSSKGTVGTIYPYLSIDFAKEDKEGFGQEVYSLVAIDGEKGYYYRELVYDSTTPLLKGHHLSEASPDLPAVVLGYNIWQKYFNDVEPETYFTIKPPSDVTWLKYNITDGEIRQYPFNTSDYPRMVLFGILEPNYLTDNLAFVSLRYFMKFVGLHDAVNNTIFIPKTFLVFQDATNVNYETLTLLLDSVVDINGYDNQKRAQRSIEKYIDFEQTINGWLVIVISIISLITILSVSNTMIMSVAERRREIGILKAVGITRAKVLGLIVAEALVLCLIAIAIGGTIGTLTALFFDMNFQQKGVSMFFAPAIINEFVIIGSIGLPLLFGTIASIYPGIQAAKMDPCEVLRFW